MTNDAEAAADAARFAAAGDAGESEVGKAMAALWA